MNNGPSLKLIEIKITFNALWFNMEPVEIMALYILHKVDSDF